MNLMTFILTVTMVWIVLILIALPIGLKMPKEVKKGHADSAPEKHYVGSKILITFLLSVVISFVYWYIVYT